MFNIFIINLSGARENYPQIPLGMIFY